MHLARSLITVVWLGVLGGVLAADAFVRTRAMTATTIAEVFLEPDAVRIEMEIGVADMPGFGNLLPDEIRERLELPAVPLAQRLPRFFEEDLVLRLDDSAPVMGRITELRGQRRLKRDEITGEPLPTQPEDAEATLFVEIVYPLEGPPSTLTLSPPVDDAGMSSASVGFVLYHRGVAVNDFRYLSRAETVDLDWEDPWFSRFRNKNLWRQLDAPLSAFLYVEPFEVRKEIVVRPRDLQQWVDLGLEGRDTIPPELWGTVRQEVADYLIERCPVVVDGRAIAPVLDRVHFLERSLKTTRVLVEPEELPLVSATLGVIIVYPVTSLPEEVTMTWELFGPRIQRVPSAATDEAGGMPAILTPEDPVLLWRNFLTNPTVPGIVALAPPPGPAEIALPIVSLACILAAMASFFGQRPARRIVAVALLLAALGAWPYARVHARNPLSSGAPLTDEDAGEVVVGLLRNVYRAFDFREEETIYDTLAQSADGELLTQVYLETRRALELENQGGARARVQEVVLEEAERRELEDGAGFASRCTWSVTGSVGHWGHLHQRRNRYWAELEVRPVDGSWRITGLELLSEERL